MNKPGGPDGQLCGNSGSGLALHRGEQSHMQSHQVAGLGNCKLIQYGRNRSNEAGNSER